MFASTFEGEIFPTITCQESYFLRADIKCPCSKYVPKVHLRADIILVRLVYYSNSLSIFCQRKWSFTHEIASFMDVSSMWLQLGFEPQKFP